MRFLLTGATGFIGKRLIDAILDGGHYASYLTRRVKENERRNVGQYYWDMRSPAPAEAFHEVDVAIHLAGEPVAQRWDEEVKKRIRESRVSGTRHLVESLARLESRPHTLLCASATGFYGDRADEKLVESSTPGSGFLPGVCVEWEREADRAATLGMRVVKLRTGIVLGREGGALEKMLPPFRLGVGGTLGSGEQWMSWIHLDDLVRMYLWLADGTLTAGPVNAVAPAPVRNAEFTRSLAKALNRPAFLPVPAFALRLLYGEMAQVLLESQRVLPRAAESAGFDFEFPRLEDALEDLVA
jgi:hypothetical protein